MLPAAPGTHNHSPPQTFFLTDVDQSFNMKKSALLSSINYRHQIGIHYFLRRNPHATRRFTSITTISTSTTRSLARCS
jgi:hypothetical protein